MSEIDGSAQVAGNPANAGAGEGGAPAAAVTDWTAGLDPDVKEFVGVKGWKEPKAVVESYRNLEKIVGADKIVVPKADAPDAEWNAVWDKLGRPKTPDEYGFKAPDGFPEGLYSADAAKEYAQAAHKAGLTAKQAAAIHDWFAGKTVADFQTGTKAAEEAKAALDAELRKEWGQAYDGKLELARRAAAAFGSKEALDALDERMGGAAMVKMWATIGEKMGEDTLLQGSGGGFGMTPAQGKAEISRLHADGEFMKAYMDRWHPAHNDAVKRMEAAHAAAYPEAHDAA